MNQLVVVNEDVIEIPKLKSTVLGRIKVEISATIAIRKRGRKMGDNGSDI